MLYLEARCLCTIRAAGAQGVQNGGISTVALAMAVPAGTREILAENLLAAWLDLEVASGNDAISSHSDIRKTAKLMGQFLPGTDFVTSGYSVMPRYDNMFGGGNYDANDIDDWLTIQRDWQVDAGLEPLAEEDAVRVREKGALAVQAVFAELGFPEVTDEEVELATTGYDSRDLPDRDRAADVLAGDRVLGDPISALDVALALDRRGFPGRRGGGARHAAPAHERGLPADIGHREPELRGRVGRERSQRLHGAGNRLPARGRALGTAATAAAPARRAWVRGRRRPRRPPRRARRRGSRHRA